MVQKYNFEMIYENDCVNISKLKIKN